MAERSVIVRLGANISDYQREMAKAKTPLDELVKRSGDASGEATTLMGKLSQSAKLQANEWRTAGQSLMAVGVAMAGVSAVVAKTGIGYNTLQQTSRAALRTILGSAEAANAQMDKLDEFARTSPFSKAVFLEAQQQMLGFGIEARKVVPYLDAIQNAVAATGGSNQDIAELTRIFSQIQSSAKITAQDLMQFGTRGVDAASLIGSQMGKTASQIREDITSGALDAGQALDALAAGMQERFGGAAAGVKDTFDGAMDRIKAAFRDLSAEIMSGAVNPEGGGWLVDLVNLAADFLRWVERLPGPVKTAVGAIGALGGASLIAVGGFMTLIPRIWETHTAWTALAKTFPRGASAIKGVGLAAGGAAAFLAGLMIAKGITDTFRDAAPAAEDYAAALIRLADGIDQVALSRLFEGLSGPMFDAHRLEPMAQAMRNIDQHGNDLIGRFLGLNDAADLAIARFDDLTTALLNSTPEQAIAAYAQLAQAQEEAGWSTERLHEHLGDYISRLQLSAAEAGLAELSHEQLAALLSGEVVEGYVLAANGALQLADGQKDAAGAMEDAETAAQDLAAANKSVADQMLDVIRASEDARRAIDDLNRSQRDGVNAYMDMERAGDRYRDTLSDLTDQIKQNGTSLDENSDKGRSNRAYIRDLATQARDYTDAMLANGASVDDVNAKMSAQREELLKVLQRFGITGEAAQEYADQLGLIPNYVETLVAVPGATLSKEQARDLNRELADTPDEVKSEIIIAANRWGYDEAMRLLNDARGKRVTSYIDIITTQQIRKGVDPRLQNLHQADGGVVDYYGGGGIRENHVAQIAPAGAWRVWAEPETGGEAYIPLAASKRARSLDIWRETGARLGVPREWLDAARFNNGGFYGSTPSVSVSPSLAIDHDALASASEAGMMRALSRARFQLDGRDVSVTLGLDNLDVRMHAQGRR